ncbi:MAG: hypothetical protein V6Z81_07650 [Parvularculales bacterium]
MKSLTTFAFALSVAIVMASGFSGSSAIAQDEWIPCPDTGCYDDHGNPQWLIGETD